MAWREARGSPGKFAIAVMAMGVAAAAASGLRGITAGFARDEFNHARTWIAADISAVYFGAAPTEEQRAAIHGLGAGVEATVVAELGTWIGSDQAADPVTAMVKVVDSAAYPFYGRLELTSGGDARPILDAGEVLASPDLLEALRVRVGSTIRIAGTDFRVGGVIRAEPDRFAIPSAPVGRAIMSSTAARGIGLTDFGARGFFRVLLRTPPQADRRRLCGRLEEIFPDARVIDFTSRTPETSAVSVWIVPVLNAIGFLTLVLGALTVAAAVYFHLLRNLNTVATLKCLGATATRIRGVYVTQAVALASVGVLGGLAARYWVEALIARAGARFAGVEAWGAVGFAPSGDVILLSVAAAVLAAQLPLSRIGRIPPAVLLRRDAGEPRRRVLDPAATLMALGFAALLACQAAQAWRTRAYSMVGLCVIFFGADQIIRGAIRMVSRTARRPALPWFVRQGMANLSRYGAQSRIAAMALGSVVAFLVCVLMLVAHVRSYIAESIPFRSANLLALHLDQARKAQLLRELETVEGVERAPEFVPTGWLAMDRAGVATLEQLRDRNAQTFIQRDWPATCSSAVPSGVEVVQGRWWTASEREPAVAISKDLAALFEVAPGSVMDFSAWNRRVHARVMALVRIPAAQRAWWREIILNQCGALPNPLDTAALTIAPERLAAVRDRLRRRFPDLILFEMNELLDRIGQAAREELSILLAIGIFAACASAALLAAIVRSMRAFREHEIAMLRALGARRRKMSAALAAEYGALGAISGLLGASAGAAGASALLRSMVGISQQTFHFSTIILAGAASGLCTAAIAVAASISLFRLKPLAVLRRR